jgi:prolyl oligopeptidase
VGQALKRAKAPLLEATLLTLLLSLSALAQSDDPELDRAPLLMEEAAEDPFLWLEEVQGERALDQVRSWNAATVERFAEDPWVATFEAEAMDILTSDARIPSVSIRGKMAYNFWQDPDHVRGLWRRQSLTSFIKGSDEWDVILDVDALDAEEGQNWLWHGASCAPNSDHCMVDLSRGGTDASEIREFNRETRTFIDGGFHVPEAKSDVTWVDEDTLFVATDRGDGTLTDSGYARTIVRWERGTDMADAPVVFEGEATDVSVSAFVAHHGGESYPFLNRGITFYESEVYYAPNADTLTKLPLPPQSWIMGVFNGDVLVLNRQEWTADGQTYPSGALFALNLETLTISTVMTPAQGESIESVAIGKKSLGIQMLSDVVGQVRRLRYKKGEWVSTTLDLPDNGVVSIEADSDSSDDLLVSFESMTVPTTLYHINKKDRVTPIQSLPATYDAGGITVEQRFATSSDGTQIPYFVMGRTDVLEAGSAPTLQYGYGGFLAAILPTYFSESARPQHGALAGKIWVERGGVLVLSNIRGGSEYGPDWHSAALTHNRQLAYDDFFAIGDALVADGVTTPEQLGALGRSNGGLLMGVAMTQRPDLYAAIDCGVPLLDMQRYHLLLAGASWMGEYGNPDVPEDWAVLQTYSPYQNVAPNIAYPAMLFYTSTLDDRVHPGHARKMAATLESYGLQFEYMENIEGGHGGVANQQQSAHRLAMEFAFFARELGLRPTE